MSICRFNKFSYLTKCNASFVAEHEHNKLYNKFRQIILLQGILKNIYACLYIAKQMFLNMSKNILNKLYNVSSTKIKSFAQACVCRHMAKTRNRSAMPLLIFIGKVYPRCGSNYHMRSLLVEKRHRCVNIFDFRY